jgi:hypothetical protein
MISEVAQECLTPAEEMANVGDSCSTGLTDQ